MFMGGNGIENHLGEYSVRELNNENKNSHYTACKGMAILAAVCLLQRVEGWVQMKTDIKFLR